MYLLKNLWCRHNLLAYFLWPFSFLYRAMVALRRLSYRMHLKKTTYFSVPVIVVGNITVGGTGKTPLIIWMVNYLRQQGFNPGIVSRGYGGKNKIYPLRVTAMDDPKQVGDEAILLAKNTDVPLVIAPNRVAAVKKLLNETGCDVVLSDDGLQHYALGRNIEIAVIDGERRFSNGFCLPAGPLREPITRLKQVDFVVVNGGSAQSSEYQMRLMPGLLHSVSQPETVNTFDQFKNKEIHAVAAIGNPDRFFNLLQKLGLTIIPHPFPDHHLFQPKELDYGKDAIIIMTEKDAVKCTALANGNMWYLPVQAELSHDFSRDFLEKLHIFFSSTQS